MTGETKLRQAFYVFDLDGTLADCQHRVHHLERKDWRAFFAACADDKPIAPIIELMLRLWRASPRNRIEIWSGRSDECRAQTVEWLHANGIVSELLTNMRREGDHRPDHIIKREFLLASDARPDIIFDDRNQVVDMWRAEGLTCLQVAPGDF